LLSECIVSLNKAVDWAGSVSVVFPAVRVWSGL